MLNTIFWKKYFTAYDVLNLVIPYQELLQMISDIINPKEGMFILDVGAGTGNLALKLTNLGARVIALDNSPEGLARYKEKDAKAETILHDATKPLPFADNHFDGLVTNNTIYTLPPKIREDVFKEFYRVIKPGGRIVVANVHTGFKPLMIYREHIKKQLAQRGFIYTSWQVISLVVPTIKIFYYNAKIKKEHREGDFGFMEKYDQQKLLDHAGFKNVSENISVYAGQGILNSAEK